MANAAQAQAKQLLPNQHLPLHFLYGPQGCCLCGKDLELQRARDRITELELELLSLKSTPVIVPDVFTPIAASKDPRNRRERRRGDIRSSRGEVIGGFEMNPRKD